MSPDTGLRDRTRELAYTLVGWPSVTGTPDEAAFAPKLAGLLADLPYFRAHPENLVVAPIEGDPNGRANVLALVRGTGARTVILSGHFDVVPVDDYGDLAPLAGSPDALRVALIDRLKATGGHRQALADLQSGQFLPGRGMLDMKSGLAAGIAVIEAFSDRPGRDGNLLLVATPDEEENSCGMRAITEMLPGFLAERGLDAALGINLDATCDTGDGRDGRVVTMGTIGKLLVGASVFGRDCHACYPFDGVNSAYLAAELAVEMECAPELSEVSGPDMAAPPTALALKDGKTVYNVTTPGRSFAFWNVLIHRRTPQDVLATVGAMAERSVERARRRIAERAAAIDPELAISDAWSSIRVMRFSELMAAARTRPDFEAEFAAEAARLAESSLDLPTRSRILTERAWDAAGLDGAAIVLAVASMPYPAIAWEDSAENRRTEAAIEAATGTIAARENISIEKRAFFPAISDMSFLGPQDRDALAATAQNTPLWGSTIRWSLDGPSAGFPVVNIGPWGRDYHHWLERTHADYTFRVLPALVSEVADAVLKGDG